MRLEFTLEKQEKLYQDLNAKLKEYFKPYQINLQETEIYFDICTKGDEGWVVIYALRAEVNGEKHNIRCAMCEFVTDGTNIISVEYPDIPNDVKERELDAEEFSL